MLRLRHQRIMRRYDDRGNIIVAITVIMVLFSLCSVAAVRTVGNEQVVSNRQNNFTGIASADAGIADALFRLDQGTSGTGTGTYFCSNSSDAHCTISSVAGAPGVTYVARQIDSADWTIQAEGMINGVYGAIQEKAVRTSRYHFALFGNTGLDFSGHNTAGFGTYSGNQPESASNPNTSGPVAVGSNGNIDCHGGLPSNVTAVYYSKGGAVSGGCSSSANPSLYKVPAPQAPASGSYQGCPNSGQLGSNFTGGASLAPGTYLCTQPITISGTLSIGGAFSNGENPSDTSNSSDTDACDPTGFNYDTDGDIACVYVILDLGTYGPATNAITISTGNTDTCPPPGTTVAGSSSCANIDPNLTPPPGTGNPPLPDAEQLQILTNSNGGVGNSNGHGFYFGGILYAPQAQLTANGCKSTFYGAAVINTLFCHGSPNFSVYYDSDLGSLYGSWATTGFTQIPPSTVSWP